MAIDKWPEPVEDPANDYVVNRKRARPSNRVEPTMRGDKSVFTCWPEADDHPLTTPSPVQSVAPKNHKEEQKPETSLLPMDLLIKYLVPAFEEGNIKYERDSWRKGFPVSVMIDALRRHESLFTHGHEDYDPEAAVFKIKKHHLGAVMFCCLAILHTLDTRPELDDRWRPLTTSQNPSK